MLFVCPSLFVGFGCRENSAFHWCFPPPDINTCSSSQMDALCQSLLRVEMLVSRMSSLIFRLGNGDESLDLVDHICGPHSDETVPVDLYPLVIDLLMGLGSVVSRISSFLSSCVCSHVEPAPLPRLLPGEHAPVHRGEPKPESREFVLRTVCQRPTGCGLYCPQRLYAKLSNEVSLP